MTSWWSSEVEDKLFFVLDHVSASALHIVQLVGDKFQPAKVEVALLFIIYTWCIFNLPEEDGGNIQHAIVQSTRVKSVLL